MRTALLFGSFNPIHVGHLILGQSALNMADADEVWFVVSPQNPFKDISGLAPAAKRVAMARIATQGCPKMRVCDIELKLPLPSYTIRTIDALEAEYPDRSFQIMIGGDNVAGLPQWREAERLFRKRTILVYPRNDSAIDGAPVERLGGKIELLRAPQIDISSTMLRRWASQGKDLTHFTPQGVADYIRQNALYSQTTTL